MKKALFLFASLVMSLAGYGQSGQIRPLAPGIDPIRPWIGVDQNNFPFLIQRTLRDEIITRGKLDIALSNYVPGGGGAINQLPADWTAITGVTRILNKPSVFATDLSSISDMTAFARQLATDASASAMRTRLGVAQADWNATSGPSLVLNKPLTFPTSLSLISDASTFGRNLLSDPNQAAAQSRLGLILGTTVEPFIASGTNLQYWAGDKTWKTLDKNAVGLSLVDNTQDVNKPISNATQTALNAKEPTIAAGIAGQYWTGTKTWATLNKAAVGLSLVDNVADANKTFTAAQTISGKFAIGLLPTAVAYTDSNATTIPTMAQYRQGLAVERANYTNLLNNALNNLNLYVRLGTGLINTADSISIDLTAEGNRIRATTGLSGNNVTVGNIPPAVLGTGTRDGTKYLRDDGTWQTVASSGGSTTTITESKIRRGTTGQSVANTTTTTLTFDTEVNDPLNIWDSTNPNNITVPGTGNKVVRLYTQVVFGASANGYRQVQVAQNGTALYYEMLNQASANNAVVTSLRTTFEVYCVGGDVLTLQLYQNSGGALNVSAQVQVQVFDRLQ